MSKLIAVSFPESAPAFGLRADLVKMQSDYLLSLDDVVVVTRNDDGKPKLHQAVNLTGAGALAGGWWGMFIGLLFLAPLASTAIGAATGALVGALSDRGIDDRFMREVAANLKRDEAMVFILARDITFDKVMEGLAAYRDKGRIVTTSLSRKDEDSIRALLETPLAA